ncbi:MAG: LamG domain-containing protein [Clostridiaceae bacterium]|nr:LamG domain-containing protein [Clostridiaceae bacterium]
MKIKRIALLTIAVIMCLSVFMVSASTKGYVTEGLVGFFDGTNNQGNKHDKQSTTWKDLSGSGNDITVILNEKCKWNDNGYFNDSTRIYLPQALTDLINSNEFTVEIVLNTFTSKGLHYNPIMNCDNDMFSLFRRIGDEVMQFKNNGNPRPTSLTGVALGYLSERVTLTITYKVGGKSTMYINGEKIDSQNANVAVGADRMFFGHDDETRNFSTNYEYIRFYNRELSADEVSKNYNEDLKAANPTTGVTATFFYMAMTLGLAGTAFKGLKKKAD